MPLARLLHAGHAADGKRASREPYLALQAARQREASAAYGKQYAKRAGIEGTLSQGIRRCRLRRTRYIGLAKTHLQHIVTAAALNFVRLSNWLGGTPLAKTRRSSFAKLMVPFPT